MAINCCSYCFMGKKKLLSLPSACCFEVFPILDSFHPSLFIHLLLPLKEAQAGNFCLFSSPHVSFAPDFYDSFTSCKCCFSALFLKSPWMLSKHRWYSLSLLLNWSWETSHCESMRLFYCCCFDLRFVCCYYFAILRQG